MTKASDNDYPSVLLTEQGSTPSSPAASHQRLYIRTSDHTLVTVNSSGAVAQVATGGTASVVNAHGCRIKRASGSVSVGNNVMTVIGFDAEDYDTDTMHDTVTNNSRIVIPSISGVTTGLWEIMTSGYSNATTRVDCMLRKNANAVNSGGTMLGVDLRVANNTTISYGLVVHAVLSAADYVETFVRSAGATGQVTFEADDSPIFMAAFLGKVT